MRFHSTTAREMFISLGSLGTAQEFWRTHGLRRDRGRPTVGDERSLPRFARPIGRDLSQVNRKFCRMDPRHSLRP